MDEKGKQMTKMINLYYETNQSIKLTELIRFRDACLKTSEIYFLTDGTREELKAVAKTIQSMIENFEGEII